MDALLTTFLAALIGEVGDKTHLLAMLLGARFARHGQVIAGIAVAALANSALAAGGATAAAAMLPFRAVTFLLALALLSAAAGSLWRVKPPTLTAYPKLGAFGASLFAFFVLEFGDKTQFLTFALSARSGEPVLAAAGATAGIIAAAVPAVLIGPELEKRLPIAAIRYTGGGLFLLLGLYALTHALRLV